MVQSSKLAPVALKLAALASSFCIVVQFGAPAHAQMSENKVQMPQLLFHPPQTAHPYPSWAVLAKMSRPNHSTSISLLICIFFTGRFFQAPSINQRSRPEHKSRFDSLPGALSWCVLARSLVLSPFSRSLSLLSLSLCLYPSLLSLSCPKNLEPRWPSLFLISSPVLYPVHRRKDQYPGPESELALLSE